WSSNSGTIYLSSRKSAEEVLLLLKEERAKEMTPKGGVPLVPRSRPAIRKAAGDCRTPRRFASCYAFVGRASVLECGSPLPLSAQPLSSYEKALNLFALVFRCAIRY